MKILSLIESFYPQLSKQEKKIADYIKIKKQDIALMSLQEITKEILVSEATITRFTRKLGFKGFIDFKLEVAREHSSIKKNIKGDYIENISKNIYESINATKNLLDKKELEKAIKFIEKTKNIFVFGIGGSGLAAKELQIKFIRYGKAIICESINHFQIMYASTLTKDDLIIAISLTGETRDLVYPVEIAKSKNCKIIAITNYVLSPLGKLADVTLLTAGRETPLDGGTLISKISQLYVIDLLATGYAIRNKEKAEKSKENIALAIVNQK